MTTAVTMQAECRGGQFAPGCSGNLAGMKLGIRHRATRLAEKMMADDAGDMTAAGFWSPSP